MRKFFKRAVSFFLIPATRWYLKKERSYNFDGIEIKVPPTVFHPGLFPSTRFLLSYLKEQNLDNKKFLELGCGSGLISIWAAKQYAEVLCCDLNPAAVKATEENSNRNKINLKVFHSDLFDALPKVQFDWIVINPPYYSKKVSNEEELAWNCGEDFEYFRKLFKDLPAFLHPTSRVIMVLTQGCNVEAIQQIAQENNFVFDLKRKRSVLFDGFDFIFEIRLINN